MDKAIEKTGESALGRVVGKEVVFDSEGDSDYVLETRFSPAEGEENVEWYGTRRQVRLLPLAKWIR